MHVHEKPLSPEVQRLPLFVLVTRAARVFILEGWPEYDELQRLIREVLTLPGESPSPSK